MPTTKESPDTADQLQRRAQPEQKRAHIERLRVSATGSIASALVTKDGGVFFLCRRDGTVPVGGRHGLGLYYHDCRFLNGYEMHVQDTDLDLLAATATRGFSALIQLTNLDIEQERQVVEKEQVGIAWTRTVDGGDLTLKDSVRFSNYGTESIDFAVSLAFSASFESIFTVRGMAAEKRGQLHAPAWQDSRLHFRYDGADGICRTLTIAFSPAPRRVHGTTADFDVRTRAGGQSELNVALAISETADARHTRRHHADGRRGRTPKEEAADLSLAAQTGVKTDSAMLATVMDRALRDLHMLENHDQGQAYYSAGVPWYVALFGRDSLISAFQTLAFKPEMAAQTLRLLAHYQGEHDEEWRDENPGKILHELRVGEMAHLNEIPQTPYYGTVDATPLFLMLVARHAAWTGSLEVFDELRPNVERALAWISSYGDRDNDGFVEYWSGSSKGLANQGWKDSGEAIMNRDGSLATPPISLVEVQGYLFMAERELAALYRRSGDDAQAARFEKDAAALRDRFNRAFWLDDLAFYALALQNGDRPCAVVASNPGQALWTGIVATDKAGPTVRRLMADDMFTGWGIRTLSNRERRYNPIGYHIGTVWPHDNSLIAAGFRRFGFAEEACRVFQGVVEAASRFPHSRLPEVFAGFSRDEFPVPVRYPVACHPQAWAAGSVPFLVETLLGLQPDAFERRLRVVDPVLPESVHYLELHRMRVGPAHVSLRFERSRDGAVSVDVLKREGEIEIDVVRR
jgi:glycogen debranching enzyme